MGRRKRGDMVRGCSHLLLDGLLAGSLARIQSAFQCRAICTRDFTFFECPVELNWSRRLLVELKGDESFVAVGRNLIGLR